MDRQGSLMVCQQVRHAKSNAVAITLPIGEENDFKGIVDLVKMKLLYGMMIRKGRLLML
jgi:elongation factor G